MTSKFITIGIGVVLIFLAEAGLWYIFMQKIQSIRNFIPLQTIRITVIIHSIIAMVVLAAFMNAFWTT